MWSDIQKKMKELKIKDPRKLESPRLEHGDLQPVLQQRAEEHRIRDGKRQRTEDTSAYVNGALFGFDPNIPMEDQVEGWRSATEPEPEKLAELGIAGKAWLKQEQRKMGGDN